MDVRSIFAAMQQHAELAAMPFLDFNLSPHCASQLKDNILQPQPHTISILVAPEVLPPSINTFLAVLATLSEDAVDVLWGITKDLIWTLPTLAQAVADEEEAFRCYGHAQGISMSNPPFIFAHANSTNS
jgi:hypothetical protein